MAYTADLGAPNGVPMLAVEDLSVGYGGSIILNDVSLHVERGELLGLIGPNGAGKTTLFEVVSGFVRPQGGQVRLDGQDVTSWSPQARARAGLGRSFQDAGLFPAMSITDALQVSLERHVAPATDPIADLFKLPAGRRTERWSRKRAQQMLEQFGLEDAGNRLVSELSTGMRRILELACVLALEPVMLLLDEPTAGIAQGEIKQLVALLEGVRAETGVTTLLIEHDIPTVMRLSDRVYVLDAGRRIAEGEPDEVATDPAVVEAYLGRGFEGAGLVGGKS